MPTYLTPGVYFEAVDTTRGNITAIRTDIAAFVGLAERGPLDDPWPVDSWRQFQTLFGGFIGGGYLAYAVKAFFENGGRRCYVVRVADDKALAASGQIPGRDGTATLEQTTASTHGPEAQRPWQVRAAAQTGQWFSTSRKPSELLPWTAAM